MQPTKSGGLATGRIIYKDTRRGFWVSRFPRRRIESTCCRDEDQLQVYKYVTGAGCVPVSRQGPLSCVVWTTITTEDTEY